MDIEQQQVLIERLYETESLTDNLTDTDAKALLKWAEGQIRNDTNGEIVIAAVGAANASGTQGVQALVAQANAFVVQQLNVAAQASTQTQSGATDITSAPMQSATAPGAAALTADASVGAAPAPLVTATASVAVAPVTKAPSKKSRRKKRKSK